MHKNIVICLDGTGNEIEERETNVLRLFRILKNVPDDETSQLVYYHPGVGTMGQSSLGLQPIQKAHEIIGLAFGKGLEAEVLNAYGFICKNYRGKEWDKYRNATYDGDRIYLFGFSRGAYGARVLAGFIHLFGLVHPSKLHMAVYAFRAYRRISDRDEGTDRETLYADINKFSDVLKPQLASIRFLGLWDTVSSMLRFEPSKFSLIRYGNHPAVAENCSVSKVRHALAIDEKRSMFRNNQWLEGQTHHQNRFKQGEGQPQDVKQMWFAGYHSDVGGSAPEMQAGLSKITLKWMLEELCDDTGECELDVDDSQFRAIVMGRPHGNSKKQYSEPDYTAPVHDSMNMAWKFLEYFPKLASRRSWFKHVGRFPWYLPKSEPRVIPKDAHIHPTALQRYHDEAVHWRPANLARFLREKDRDAN